jgi:hypothetical protein
MPHQPANEVIPVDQAEYFFSQATQKMPRFVDLCDPTP